MDIDSDRVRGVGFGGPQIPSNVPKDSSDIRWTTCAFKPLFSLVGRIAVGRGHLVDISEGLAIHRHAGKHGVVLCTLQNVRIVAVEVNLIHVSISHGSKSNTTGTRTCRSLSASIMTPMAAQVSE